MKLLRRSHHLEEEMLVWLTGLSARTGVTVAEHLRRALAEYRERVEKREERRRRIEERN
jgi:adenylylsulfate kinase-like enzyme